MSAKRNTLANERNNVVNAIHLLHSYISAEDVTEDAKDHEGLALFRFVFGDTLKKESAAQNADGYVAGKLLIELKTKYTDWKSGLFQGLHYQKKGLSFQYICVISYHFIGLWKLSDLPEDVLVMSKQADPIISPSKIGKDLARKINKTTENAILEQARFLISEHDFYDKRTKETKEIAQHRLLQLVQAVNNLESGKIQINTANFIRTIQFMQRFFETPIDAVHAFYALTHYWDISAEVTLPGEHAFDDWAVQVYARVSGRRSESISVHPKFHQEFKRFVEERYIFTNEGSGLTLDYYFSRFDEVLAEIDPEYVKQHGIFFTDDHLSKFALWFVKEYAESSLGEKYIVLDPAGGSGNLVTSWRLNLKHKIVSELQPDLLRIIERRMKYDPLHIQQGFTIVPQTRTGEGLNFLDKPAREYLQILKDALVANGQKLDKPLAFLVNPPYKSTDEREENRDKVSAEYQIDADVLALTGKDAGKERYATFLAQVILICKEQQAENPNHKPLLLVFTPTSWLIPRPSYKSFREEFDKHFAYQTGFIVNAKEFFKLNGNWPVAFTAWQFIPDKDRVNEIQVHDYTHWRKIDLERINWLDEQPEIDVSLRNFLKTSTKKFIFSSRGDIRETIPKIKETVQTRYDFSHAKSKNDYQKIVSGFPYKFERGHFVLKRKCGDIDGSFVGFMDDLTPVRVRQDRLARQSSLPDRVWFRLDNDVKSSNKTRIHNGPTDKYGFCAYDLASSQSLFTWFAITKFLNGRFPIATNQLDIWPLRLQKNQAETWHSLAFAYALSANRCVETTFEADNPVQPAPEVVVQNPLAPYLQENFYNEVLKPHASANPVAAQLVAAVCEVYDQWQRCVTQGRGRVEAPCLANEPYFRYFSYAPYVGPHAGLLQIRTYADQMNVGEVLHALDALAEAEKALVGFGRDYLISELRYFD